MAAVERSRTSTAAKLGLALAVGITLLATPAIAAPVTYSVSSGALTTVQFIDLTSGQASPCPIGGTNCLSGALNLTGGSITVDEATGTLLSISLFSTNTGVLTLSGFNGYNTLSFSNLSFSTAGSSTLTSNGSVGSTSLYSFGPANGTVTTNLSASLTAGGTATVAGATFAASPSGSLAIDSSGLMNLNLTGVNLGVLCDPLNPNACVLVKADFHAGGTPAIPEPAAAAVFAVGLLGIAHRIRRLSS